MSDYTEKVDQPVAEYEFTIFLRSFKVYLKILFVFFAFCLGFILSELRYTSSDPKDNVCQQIDDFRQYIYLYDTEQKIEDYFRVYLDELGLHPESPQGRSRIDFMRRLARPLVRVGPFVVFANNDNSKFSVREQFSPFALVELQSHEQTKRLILTGLAEKDWKLPRFSTQLTYSEDGIYKGGIFSVYKKKGWRNSYFDNNGSGVFDRMNISNNDGMFRYRLNDLTWELEGQTLWQELDPLEVPSEGPDPGPMEIPSIKTQ